MSQPPKTAKEIFLIAFDTEQADRASLLEVECAGDSALRRQVEALLQVHDEPDSLLDGPRIDLGISDVALVSPGPTIDQPITEKPGTQIGPYKLLQKVGEGGMGVVYMAEQKEPVKRRVALKIIKPGMDTRHVIARFEAERQALAMMDHPHIAKVLDAGATDSGRPYFVMELVNGVSITEYCDQHRLTPRERLKLFVTICQATQHAHHKGIIHRDLKPSNILVALYDDRPIPKVIDFGVAKATSQTLTEKTMFTQLGQIVGTLEYMSPEQAQRNQLNVDTRSDIYSLGTVLYELLTGETPFDKKRLQSAGFEEMLRIIREEEPPKPSTKASSSNALPSIAVNRSIEPRKLGTLISGDLDWIVLKCLEKDRTRRYETAASLEADVWRYLRDEAIEARPPSNTYKFRKFARRNWRVLATVALLTLTTMFAVGSLGWLARDRMARQTRVIGQVELIFEEVDQLTQEHNWPLALAMAKRAEPLIMGDGPDEQTRQRVRRTLSDLKLVQQLEEARMRSSTWTATGFDYGNSDRAYAAAFREFGIDISEKEAATMLRSRTAIVIPVATALDNWVNCKRMSGESDRSAEKRLLDLAVEVDPDPTRKRLRGLWGKTILQETKAELLKLAESQRFHSQPPVTLQLLASTLERVNLPNEAVSVLRQAQQRYPADFWVNFHLANRLQEQHPSEAIRFYAIALGRRPGNTAVWNNLGLCLKDLQQMEEAINCYRKAIELDSTHLPAHVNLGSALVKQGKLSEAGTHFRKAAVLEPKRAESFFLRGRAAHVDGKNEEAISCYREALEIDPKNAECLHNLGIALFIQNELNEAIACYRQAIQLDPDLAADGDLGVALARQGKLDEAIAAWRQAIKLNPNISTTHSNLGTALEKRGELDDSIAACRRAIKLDPNNAGAYVTLSNAFLEQGKLDDSIAACRQAIEVDPNNTGAYNNLGVALCEQGKLEDAIAACRQAIKLDKDNTYAHANLGHALLNQGKLQEAIMACRESIKLKDRAAPHNWIGYAFARQGKLQEAIMAWRQAIELKEDHAEAHAGLGTALARQGEIVEAIAELRRAVTIKPTLVGAQLNLGIALRKLGKLDEALAAFRQLIKVKSDEAQAYGGLGNALEAKGEFAAAIKAFQRGMEMAAGRSSSPYPFAQSIRHCEQLIELEKRLPAVLAGEEEVVDAQERLAFAEVCYFKQLFERSVRFSEEAFAEDSTLAKDHRYYAACSAALAGAGLGQDIGELTDSERARRRQQARNWLRADLQEAAKRTENDNRSVRMELQNWLQDADLRAIRDEEFLKKLPPDERQRHEQLWRDVKELLARAQAKPAKSEN